MTVVVENPQISMLGNGTKTGYSFSFSFSDLSEIQVFYTPKTDQERLLSHSDYLITPNHPFGLGGVIDFLTITPKIGELIRVTRSTPVDQKIDFTAGGTVTPEDVEFALDKVTRILQEHGYTIFRITDSKLPDPSLKASGNLVVSDGHNAFTFHPLRLLFPTSNDDGKLLTVDYASGSIRYIPAGGATNPTIPQASSISGSLSPLISQNGAYILGASEPILTPADVGKVLRWDGSKWIGVPSTGLENAAIPAPTSPNLVLTSYDDSGNLKTHWVDDSYKTEETSSGVAEPVLLRKKTDTSVEITSGRLLVSSNALNDPTVQSYAFSGIPNLDIPTSVGYSHFVYLTVNSDGTISPSIETTLQDSPRGNKIFIGEIEHTRNNVITQVVNKSTVLNSIPFTNKRLYLDYLGNAIKDLTVAPLGLIGAGATQLSVTSGTFIGYDANLDINPLNPHVRSNLPALAPAPFSWVRKTGASSAPTASIDFNTLLFESGGTLTAIPNNHFAQTLIWEYPNGDISIEYPRSHVTNVSELLSRQDFVSSFSRDTNPSLKRNAALIGYLQLKQGSNFAATTSSFVISIGGSLLAASAGGGVVSATVPFPLVSDAGKNLVVNPSGFWGISSYTTPTPTPADAGKFVGVTTQGSYALTDASDPIARTTLTNGVINGITPITILASQTSIGISPGKLFFCDDLDGIPINVKIVDFPGVTQFDLTDISTKEYTYINISSTGQLSEAYAPLTATRGSIQSLLKINHSDNLAIDSIEYTYFDINVLPEQVKEIWDAIGYRVKNLIISSDGTNALKHTGGLLFGFNVSPTLRAPHRISIPAKNPVPLVFVQKNGTETLPVLAFPDTPKIEDPINTLVDLPATRIAYYPVFFTKENRLLITYPTKSYAATDPQPTLAELSATLPTVPETAFFWGIIKWEMGKNFSNGNTIERVTVSTSAGGGAASAASSGLPPSTAADEKKVFQIGAQGVPELGATLDFPKKDGSDLSSFAGHLLQYSTTGSIVPTTQEYAEIGAFNVPKQGRFLAAFVDGKLSFLSNKTDFVDPNLWDIENFELYAPAPIEQMVASKGMLLTLFTQNDSGGGLSKNLRLADMFDGESNAPNYVNRWLLPNIPANADEWRALTELRNAFKVPYPAPPVGKIYFYVPQGGASAFDESFFAPNGVELVAYSIISSPSRYFNGLNHLTNLSVDKVKVNAGFSVYYDGYAQMNVSNCLSLRAIFGLSNPTKNAGVVSVTSNFATITLGFFGSLPTLGLTAGITGPYMNIDLLPSDLELEIQIFTTSSTKPSKTLFYVKKSDMIKNADNSVTVNINVVSGFTFGEATYYHCEYDTIKSEGVYFGFQVRIIAPYQRLTANTLNPLYTTPGADLYCGVREIDFSFTFETPLSSSIQQKRFEFGTLKTISEAAPEIFKVWQGAAPALTYGEIYVVYRIMFPKTLKNSADFDPDTKAIYLHPYVPQLSPSIFLEEQNGTSKYTRRIEFTKQRIRSTIFGVYKIICTEEQFNNWKLAIYFNTDSASLNTMLSTYGVSVWFLNTSNFPN